MPLQIGEVLESKNYGRFEVMDLYAGNKARIKFLNTGSLKTTDTTSIRLGAIKDKYAPSVYGHGYIGEGLPAQVNGKMQRSYVLWKECLRRSYDEKHLQRFPTYRGCEVCERWLNYQNFAEDIKQIEGYDIWLDPNSGYQLDKDIKCPGTKIYSPETCMFVSARVNSLDANSRPKIRRIR